MTAAKPLDTISSLDICKQCRVQRAKANMEQCTKQG